MTIAFFLGCIVALLFFCAWTIGQLEDIRADLATKDPDPVMRLGPPPQGAHREAAYIILYRIAWGRRHSRQYMMSRYGISAHKWNRGHQELKKLGIWDGQQLLMTYEQGVSTLDAYFDEIQQLREMGEYVTPY